MSAVRFPADVDREDRLVWGLTARQLGELAAGVVAALLLRSATAALPLPVSAGVSLLPVVVAAALALGRHDGLGADRFALAWLEHRRRPKLLVAAGEGVVAPPEGFGDVPVPAPLDLPVRGVSEGGVVDLGAAGCALVCRASALNFGLRTEDEQTALVGIMARWLNSLAAPVQIVVHTEPVDVGRLVAELEAGATALPHPDLEAAARDHARFLGGLAGRRNVLRREVLLVFHAPANDDVGRVSLHQRADEAVVSLAAAGIVVQPLDEHGARGVLARCADPADPAPAAVLTAAEDRVVSGAGR
ncbi:MAG: hypothetical protein QOK43_1115 [Acidimicrobiaceae bacterium]|nr:hypothetical protein [Acidimicrobiaceae bacterium]